MKQSNAKREAIILGALLHDVGKLAQRAKDNPERPKQNHSHWGQEWFQNHLAEKLTSIFSLEEKQIISSAINNHHFGEEFISLADSISAGMDRIDISQEEEKGDPFTDRMVSIFSRASISDRPKKEMYHQIAPLGKDNLKETFPIENNKCTSEEYLTLFTYFNDKLKKTDFSGLSPKDVIDQIYFLLWKYMWCIPSATYKHEPDISLFDHLKTTAAITGCLYDYCQENPKNLNIESPAFALIGGDISGIQNYIFDVLTQQGRVAKRLRARSFIVQLISEIASHKIIHLFNLPLCNVLSSAGGNFYILLPNIKEFGRTINDIQVEFDRWTYENFKGEIYLSLGWTKVSGEEFFKFEEVLERLKSDHQGKKLTPYCSLLISEEKWAEKPFVLDEVIQGDEAICPSCHKHPIENKTEQVCSQCLADVQIGKRLPRSKYLAFFKHSSRGLPVFNYSFELWDQFENNSEAYLVVALNNTNGACLGFKYLANHVPITGDIDCTDPAHDHEVGQPVFFDCIARSATGDRLIGYVKGDVDNMGKILREGFADTRLSISRFSTLSRMLEAFFSGRLQMWLGNDFRDMYTIFSGGDDFFIIGPWDRAIDFATQMREEFAFFTAGNPDFAFSAGILFAKPHNPLSICAEQVEEALGRAKARVDKNSITIFGQVIAWPELNRVLSRTKHIIEWLEQEPPLISRGFIKNLRTYGEMSQKYDKTGETKWLKFVPLLSYDINRNLTKREQTEVRDWAVNLSPMVTKSESEDDLPYLRIIMDYVLTYTRGGQ